MIPPKVKICCISSIKEARLAIKYGASAIGLVGHMPSGPGVIEDKLIRKIAASIPPPIASFLLTSETTAQGIIEHYNRVQTNTIQLVDALTDEADYATLRTSLPMVKIVQVIHVLDDNSINEALTIAPYVDAILLDSGNPNLEVKQLGGTGRTHNWSLSKKIVSEVNVPVFLAGGLSEKNVRNAINEVRPFGLDLCSSVRTNGHLDEEKLKTFFNAMYDA